MTNLEKINEILKSDQSDVEKKEAIMKFHENDLADVLLEMDQNQRMKLYEILGNEIVSKILSYVERIDEIIEDFTQEKAAKIIDQMDSDDAVDVLEELDEEDRSAIVSLLEPEVAEDIELIHQYEENELGSKMTNNFILISKNNTVKKAMRQVIASAAENDNVSTIFVEDEQKKYYGAIDLRDLIIARDTDDFEKIIKTNYPKFYATDWIEDRIVELKDYGLDSYPILDENDHMIGALTADDVTESLDIEMKDDYAKLAGLTEEEALHEPMWTSVRKRLPWLLVLLILGLFVSMAISGFEDIVATVPLIVFFQSLILDMAGNTGTQSLAVTIRLISDQKITKKEICKTILKELRVGFVNGLILAVVSFGFVLLFLFVNSSIQHTAFDGIQNLKISGIVGFSLVVSMTVCSLIGTVIPIFFMKIKIDPAVASGPFITTMNDVIAVLIYYGLATLLLLNF